MQQSQCVIWHLCRDQKQNARLFMPFAVICSAGVNEVRKKICAALSAVLCAALLGGCSLFELEEGSANVYIAGDAVNINRPGSSSSSSVIENKNEYTPINRPSSSSSSSEKQPAAVPDERENAAYIDRYREKWYYRNMYDDDKRRRLYERLYYCAQNDIEECDVSDLDVTKNDVFETYWSFDYENPQFPRLGSGYEITLTDPRISNKVNSVKILYGRTADEVQQADFDATAQAVLEAARAQGSDYEKLKFVHDWIVKNTDYSNTGAAYESEADGPIVYGSALCEGYSKAFMYFAQSLGFECVCAIGFAGGVDHMWNMVKLGGQWYNVDATWDDPIMSDGSNTLRHKYFLISDRQIKQDHSFDTRFFSLPDAPNNYL